MYLQISSWVGIFIDNEMTYFTELRENSTSRLNILYNYPSQKASVVTRADNFS